MTTPLQVLMIQRTLSTTNYAGVHVSRSMVLLHP
jgi:hypothetical protein